MILGADNRKRWSSLDVMILQAYQIMEDERCAQHGGPAWLCDHSDPKLQVRIKESSCYAKRELEIAEDARKDKDDKGVVLVPEFYDLDGRPLESFRATYRAEKMREALEDAQD